MIYNLTLQTAGFVAGLVLILISLPGLFSPSAAGSIAKKLPRSRAAGIILLAAAFVWTFWLLATMEMGEFSSFRRPLLIALPVGFVLVVCFVEEFLAVRALGILCLLAAEPLLEAAFFRYETTRLFVTVFAYILIIAGLFWVTMPYLLRDQINWSTQSSGRWRTLHAIIAAYGAVVLILAVTQY